MNAKAQSPSGRADRAGARFPEPAAPAARRNRTGPDSRPAPDRSARPIGERSRIRQVDLARNQSRSKDAVLSDLSLVMPPSPRQSHRCRPEIVVDAKRKFSEAIGDEAFSLAHDQGLPNLANAGQQHAARHARERVECGGQIAGVPFRAVIFTRRVKPAAVGANGNLVAGVDLRPDTLPIAGGVNLMLDRRRLRDWPAAGNRNDRSHSRQTQPSRDTSTHDIPSLSQSGSPHNDPNDR